MQTIPLNAAPDTTPQEELKSARAEQERVMVALKCASGEELPRLHRYAETLSWQCALLSEKVRRKR
jgi:hypothetical protein